MAEALTHAEVLGRYVGAFVDELVAAGLEDVCLCPGSRSTPLALTFARHPKVKVWTHLDERSCAYFALGMAKVRRHVPVAILCSSGTAAVNFAPAVVEAYHARVPLIVLTTDRPPELQDVGANQTIDQVRLYGTAVKWFVQMPLPEASEEMLRYVRMVAARAIKTTQTEPAGPIHLNFPFREPLVPETFRFENGPTDQKRFANNLNPSVPLSVHAEGEGGEVELRGDRAEFAKSQQYGRGLIVLGPDARVRASVIMDTSHKLGWPVLADPLSQLRNGLHYGPNVIGAYDSFLRVPSLVESLAPDFMLRFGDPPTSKPLASYLQRHRRARQVVVAPPGRWPDPDMTADEVIDQDPASFSVDRGWQEQSRPDDAWLSAWQHSESATQRAIAAVLQAEACASEPSAFYDLQDVIPDGYAIFAGNSMPVRDLDSFYAASDRPVRFYGNRGTSGIDGVISTALGASAGSDGRLVLVIGDLSFYHDMNGLLAAKRFGLKATIVLLNNDGGGIFSFLPQNDDQEHFEALFGTPHGLDFAPAAELYGLGWQRVTTRDEYKKALQASFDSPGVNVIEIKTDRVENLKLHQRIWQEVAAAVSGAIAK